jgi:hypothetical protein
VENEDLMIGQTVLPYRILENLGGMCVVYKAEDANLSCHIFWSLVVPSPALGN